MTSAQHIDTTATITDADGNSITIDLAAPPAWVDLDALRVEAGAAGDLDLVAAIDHVRHTTG